MANTLLTPPPEPFQLKNILSLDEEPATLIASFEPPTFDRRLSDNEQSYFLPSRADGVNDMYICIGLKCSNPTRLSLHRLSLAWSILRTRHPLLASRIAFSPSEGYTSPRFVYKAPRSPEDALHQAQQVVLDRGIMSKDDLISSYLNGPRTLGNDMLSCLMISREAEGSEDVNLVICTVHFIGDGMALHATANDIFTLLAGAAVEGGSEVRTDRELEEILRKEWTERWGTANKGESIDHAEVVDGLQPIPASSESRLPQTTNKFQAAAIKVDFQRSEAKLIGGHTFPKSTSPVKRARKTQVNMISFDATQTKAALKKCKSEGVTISNALFAACNLAWIRTTRHYTNDLPQQPDLPMMMYTAINLRPYLYPTTSDSYWFLSLGYFNVILPMVTFEDEVRMFWHRAKSAKSQGAKYMKSPMLLGRTQEMARERGERARKWAKVDDDAEAARVQEESHKVGIDIRLIEPGDATTMTDIAKKGLKLDIGASLPTPPASPQTELRSKMSASTTSSPPRSPTFSPKLLFAKAKSAMDFIKSKSKTIGRRTSSTLLSTPPMTPDSPSTSPMATTGPGLGLTPALSPAPGGGSFPTAKSGDGIKPDPNLPNQASASDITLSPPNPSTSIPISTPPTTTTTTPKPPSNALIGLSLLGNLDTTYKHPTYLGLTLHTLTTGSRQRSGGMLLFGYTFAGKMWVNLGWDVCAFRDGVVERFWDEVGCVLRERVVE